MVSASKFYLEIDCDAHEAQGLVSPAGCVAVQRPLHGLFLLAVLQLVFTCHFLPLSVTSSKAEICLAMQARIVGLNAQYFLKNGGFYVISIKASCIDSTAQPEAVFAREVKKLSEMLLKPKEQVTLEPYERDHAMVVGVYRPPPKAKAAA